MPNREIEAAVLLTESGLLKAVAESLERELFDAFVAAATTGATGKVLVGIAQRVVALHDVVNCVHALKQASMFDAQTGEVR
jgi:hypothetical protein